MNKGLYYVKGGFIVAKGLVYGTVGLTATLVVMAGRCIEDVCTAGLNRCTEQMDDLKRKAAKENTAKC